MYIFLYVFFWVVTIKKYRIKKKFDLNKSKLVAGTTTQVGVNFSGCKKKNVKEILG